MNVEEQNTPQQSTPRPFREIAGLWPRFWEMTEEFFRNEIPRTSVPNTVYGVLVFAVLTVLITSLTLPLSPGNQSLQELTSLLDLGKGAAMTIMVISLSLCGIFMAPISFYINNGIYFLFARLFGGRGQFTQQAYLNSLYLVPFGFLAALGNFIGLIPILGFFLSLGYALLIGVFQLVITVRSLKAVHDFSTGKAVATVLIPVLLAFMLVCLGSVLILLMPGVGSIFSELSWRVR